MRRVRWLGARWPVSMRTLASRMKEQLFTIESFDGFVIHRVREHSIEGDYVEKLSYQETVTDPFGNETIFDRVRYRRIEFTLFSEFPNIELRDAHRSTREFVSKLLELCSFSLSIEPVAVNLLRWADDFQRALGEKTVIDSVQVSGLELEAGVYGKVLLKGDRDVRDALDHLSQKRKFELEKIQVKARIGQQVVPIHLSGSGSARIPVDHWNDLLPMLRTSLANQDKKA